MLFRGVSIFSHADILNPSENPCRQGEAILAPLRTTGAGSFEAGVSGHPPPTLGILTPGTGPRFQEMFWLRSKRSTRARSRLNLAHSMLIARAVRIVALGYTAGVLGYYLEPIGRKALELLRSGDDGVPRSSAMAPLVESPAIPKSSLGPLFFSPPNGIVRGPSG